MRQLWVAIAASLLLLLGTASGALAGETWCDVDPPVVITTPGGNTAVVYVVDGGPLEHTASLLLPTITYKTQSTQGGRATKVTMTVEVPDDPLGSRYAVTSQAWSGPAQTGTLYASRSGYAGEPLTLQFTLNVP